MLTKNDVDILEALQVDGRLSNVELAKKIGLSESPCLRKTKQLEENAVIKGYKAVVDPKGVGCTISAIILVNLDQRSEADGESFYTALQDEKRVTECLAITGSADLVLRVVAKDIEDLTEFTFNGLLRHPSVKDISSCVVLKEIKEQSPLPVFR